MVYDMGIEMINWLTSSVWFNTNLFVSGYYYIFVLLDSLTDDNSKIINLKVLRVLRRVSGSITSVRCPLEDIYFMWTLYFFIFTSHRGGNVSTAVRSIPTAVRTFPPQ